MAAGIAPEARHAIAARLQGVAVPGRVVPPANWHVTLHFIGEVAPPVVDRVIHAIDETDLGSPFRVRWGSLDAFPHAARATVLWIGPASGAERLSALAATLGAGLAVAGLPSTDRPFRPHLTLARIRPPLDVTGVVSKVAPLGVVMRVDRVDLMSTRTEGRVTRYEVVESFQLV